MLRFVSSEWGSQVDASFVVCATLRFADYTGVRIAVDVLEYAGGVACVEANALTVEVLSLRGVEEELIEGAVSLGGILIVDELPLSIV